MIVNRRWLGHRLVSTTRTLQSWHQKTSVSNMEKSRSRCDSVPSFHVGPGYRLYDDNVTRLYFPFPPMENVWAVVISEEKISELFSAVFCVAIVLSHKLTWALSSSYKKLIRRWDSERELCLQRHRTRTTKYNRLVHKFRHRSTRLCVRTQVYQIQWNNQDRDTQRLRIFTDIKIP